MSSIAALAGEDVPPSPTQAAPHGEPLGSRTTATRETEEEIDYLVDGTRRLTSLSSQPSLTGELYEVLPRPEVVLPTSLVDHVTTTIGENQAVLDYGVEELFASSDHGAETTQSVAVAEAPASGEDFSVSAPTPPSAPGQESFGVAAASASLQDPVDEATPAAVPEVAYDSDPPFRTDGRGRVVWSSASASARGRKRRTSTTIPSSTVAASPPPHHDAPRDVVPADYVADRSPEGRLV